MNASANTRTSKKIFQTILIIIGSLTLCAAGAYAFSEIKTPILSLFVTTALVSASFFGLCTLLRE